MKKLLRFNVIAPVVLLLVALGTYGLMIRSLGLYWDDFPYIWFGHVLGTTQYQKVFYDERPLLSVLYNITAPIFGENILSWQIFAVTLRWLSALCVGWIVRLIWPGKKEVAFVISLLFLVYPGFGQHWISTIYCRTFILLCLFLISLGFMAESLRKKQKYLVFLILGFIFGALALLGSEYFFGLELARPVIIWIIACTGPEPLRLRIKKAALYWLPYLAEVITFGIWRGLIVKSSLYDVSINSTSTGGIPGLLWNLVSSMATNAYKGGIQAWFHIFLFPPVAKWQQTINVLYFILIIAIFLTIAWFGWKYLISVTDHQWSTRFWQNWQIQSIVLGVVMLLCGGLPVWIAKLPFNIIFPYDRFMLAMMFGSALLLTGLIYLIPKKLIRVGIICSLAALSAGWQFQTANTFRVEWKQLGGFIQQLTWRVPGMKPGTMLVAHELPFRYYSDNSLTALINWTYAPEYKSGYMPYELFYLTVRGNSALKQLEPNIEITWNYRSLEFHGNTSNMITIFQPEIGCLRILDPKFTNKKSLSGLKDPLPQAIALSNLDRIITDPLNAVQPIPSYFPQSESKSWCYYFEKADLARQLGDWKQVETLWDQAFNQSLSAIDVSEYYPFIEGLGMNGELSKAIDLSRMMVEQKPSLYKGLCQIWGRIESETGVGEAEKQIIDGIKVELRCNQQ